MTDGERLYDPPGFTQVPEVLAVLTPYLDGDGALGGVSHWWDMPV